MLTPRSLLVLAAATCLVGFRPAISGGAEIAPFGKLTAAGTIALEDGRPAADAIVSSSCDREPRVEARADANGKYQLSSHFGQGCRLYARSADGSQVATRIIAASTARTELAKDLDIKLVPAKNRTIRVTSAAGEPVAEAHVALEGPFGIIQSVAGADGTAKVAFPPGEKLRAVAVWHPTKGIAGILDNKLGLNDEAFQLSLLPTSPHTIRILDVDGRPVPDFPFLAHIRLDKNWILTGDIDAAHLKTDANGEVTIPWFPPDFQFVEVCELQPDWKIDDIERDKADKALTVVHARHKVAVSGRLKMPAGESAAGILIDTFGFGPTHTGDIPTARAAADGSFTLMVAPDHGYGLDIVDTTWASDGWGGLILADEKTPPADISIDVYRGAPLEVRVARGPERNPIASAWVETGIERPFSWRNAQDKKQGASAETRQWLRTGADGVASTAVGKGKLRVRLSTDNWEEEQEIKVADDSPASVDFYRPWLKQRLVTGKLTLDGTPYKPSATAKIEAFTDVKYEPEPLKTRLHDDGSFEILGDAGKILTFANDPKGRVSGFMRIGQNDEVITLSLVSSADVSGVLVDRAGRPLAGKTVHWIWLDIRREVTEGQVTDDQGRFRFESVPAKIKLTLEARSEIDQPTFASVGPILTFAPGEHVENRPFAEHDDAPPAKKAEPAAGLAERLAKTIANVHPCRMNALVILQGDASAPVTKLVEKLEDWDDHPEVLAYLPLAVSADELTASAAAVGKLVQLPPQAGEVVLVALDAEGKSLGVLRLTANDPAGQAKLAAAFLKDHSPPMRDANARLAAARAEAKRTGRKVWLVESGPRCGPCFRLGRWMEEHHGLLEKDYVVLKLMDGLDEHCDQVMNAVQETREGIPWFAITDAEGKILATSDGPAGNTGMPSSAEEIRHFREMLAKTKDRLSTDEIDRLCKSLEDFK